MYNGSFQTLLFANEVYEILVRETNLYARQKVAVKPDPKWRDVEKDEMKACLGIRVYMSAVKLPKTQMHWGLRSLIWQFWDRSNHAKALV